ncbi:MAG TPA: DUF4184 family protein [Noviherbaspirillum sp.]|nr:DUF4184 family protein [Noviherbaspirillum sp.]
MPFTLSHPAAIIPFRRYATRSTSLSALVIGSVSPDFVYFFHLGTNGAFSHSLAGIFLFCVPASMVVYIVYHLILRQPLLALMPDAIATRMNPVAEWIPRSVSAILVIASSFAIGAGTHVGWDAFTHGNTLVVKNFEILRTPIALMGDLKMPLYKVLQHLSSVLGLVVLAICLVRWMHRTPRAFTRKNRLHQMQQTLVIVILLAAGLVGSVFGLTTRPAMTFEGSIFNGIVGGMASMALAILAFCVYWRIRTLREID